MHRSPDEEDPVVHPWVIKALRARPKLLDIEAREEFLARLEHNVSERRRPDNIADRLARLGIRSTEEAAQPVITEQAASRFRKENTRRLRRL